MFIFLTHHVLRGCVQLRFNEFVDIEFNNEKKKSTCLWHKVNRIIIIVSTDSHIGAALCNGYQYNAAS